MGKALPQNMPQWVATVLVAVFACVGTYFTATSGFKSSQTNSQGSINIAYLENVVEENGTLRTMLVEKTKELTAVQMQLSTVLAEQSLLRSRIASLEASNLPADSGKMLEEVMNLLPYPGWIQEVENQNWFLNENYKERFSLPKKGFWTPINIVARYPDDVAAQFVENDMRIVRSGVPQIVVESFPDKIMQDVSPQNPANKWNVLKAPFVISGRSYMFGACWPVGETSRLIEAYK